MQARRRSVTLVKLALGTFELYSFSEALEIVSKRIEGMAGADEYAVDEKHTTEHEWGWVFAWNSRKYIETGDVRFALMGNGPMMFNKKTGEIRGAGSTYPIEHYIAEYETELSFQEL